MSKTIKCNLCGEEEFVGHKNQPKTRCLNCNSYPRTRLLSMFIDKNIVLNKSTKILHLAPEIGLYNKIRSQVSPTNYHICDLEPERYKFANNVKYLDLCDIGDNILESDSYDLIIHSHVLEHIPCNIAYTLFHLHRALKPNGTHLCVIPFMYGYWDECFKEMEENERITRFGQHDHVRRIGRADLKKHLGLLLRLPDSFDASDYFSEEALLRANIPKEDYVGLGISTVLSLKKGDYLLS